MANPALGQKLQTLPRQLLYVLLVFFAAIPLFFQFEIPNDPEPGAKALYSALMALPENSTVLIESDWTLSTRGESAGQFEALIRILKAKHVKFALYSVDPLGPQIAKNTITSMNARRKKDGLPTVDKWNDWIELGVYPNLEGQTTSMGVNLRNAFAGKTDSNPATNQSEDVFKSPVLKDINKIGDVAALIIVTASSSLDTNVERLSDKTKISAMVTGVMGPEAKPYFAAGQLKGLSIGLKGVYDMEYMMNKGLRGPEVEDPDHKDKRPTFSATLPALTDIEKGATTFDRGGKYYFALHSALFLMIILVVIGNVGMFMAKAGRRS